MANKIKCVMDFDCFLLFRDFICFLVIFQLEKNLKNYSGKLVDTQTLVNSLRGECCVFRSAFGCCAHPKAGWTTIWRTQPAFGCLPVLWQIPVIHKIISLNSKCRRLKESNLPFRNCKLLQLHRATIGRGQYWNSFEHTPQISGHNPWLCLPKMTIIFL